MDVLRRRVDRHPDRTAFLFLADGENEGARLTYADLDARARAIAGRLAERLSPGDRALLVYPPGLEFVCALYGCLYAGVIATPVYPPNPARLSQTLPVLVAIAEDARPSVVLTTSEILSVRGVIAAEVAGPLACPWLATDDIAADAAGDWISPARADGVAILQYTSGSTASPRGVMVTLDNLIAMSAAIHREMRTSEASVGVGWLPTYHDMGLIGNVIQPVYCGGFLVHMSPLAFLHKPVRWLRAISRFRATMGGGPNFAYDLCVRRIPEEQREGLDLSTWQIAFNGAEPVHAETMERFAAAFSPFGFRRTSFFPCYGLAEATLLVAGGADRAAAEHEGHRDDSARVSVGTMLPELRLCIVNPDTGEEVADGSVGEIWLQGTTVAAGYWRRDEETRLVFGARLAGREEQGAFLRTGDLGLRRGDQLFISGRLKDLLIVAGRNVHPEDLEWTITRRVPEVRPGCCAALAVEVNGRERLIVVAEPATDLDATRREELPQRIRSAIAVAHDLHVHRVLLVAERTLPKTSSGKLQRHECRVKLLDSALELGE